MQEYWELYMKNLEGKPASIQFNAGISMEIDEMEFTYPIVAFVKAKLKEPNEHGLLSENEEPEILFMEDKLEASMIKFRIGKYVGRILSDGHVTFLFYVQFTYNWPDFIAFALNEHTDYEVSHGHQEDPKWNFYRNLLYPTAKEWQLIQNHKVCDALKAKEDNLYLPRAIEHKCFFIENEDQKDVLVGRLESEGFKIQSALENEAGAKGFSFYRIDKPFYHDIDALTLELIDLLEAYGASYDGWETSVVKS